MAESNQKLSRIQFHIIWLMMSFLLTFIAMLSVFSLQNSIIGMFFICGIWIVFRRYQLYRNFTLLELRFTILGSIVLVIMALLNMVPIGFGLLSYFVFIYYIGLYIMTIKFEPYENGIEI